MILNDIIGKYINSYIKIGGKIGGFFFCGYIHENYNDLFNDLTEIENDKAKQYIDKLRNEKEHFLKTFKTKEKLYKGSSDKDSYAQFLENSTNKLNNINSRLAEAENHYKRHSILESLITNIYHSTVDDSTIIIIDYPVHGSFLDRYDMRKKEPYNSLVVKYKI